MLDFITRMLLLQTNKHLTAKEIKIKIAEPVFKLQTRTSFLILNHIKLAIRCKLHCNTVVLFPKNLASRVVLTV